MHSCLFTKSLKGPVPPKGGRKQAETEFGTLFFLLGLLSHVSKQRVCGELQPRLCCWNSHHSSCPAPLDACVGLPFTFHLAGSGQEMRLIKNYREKKNQKMKNVFLLKQKGGKKPLN